MGAKKWIRAVILRVALQLCKWFLYCLHLCRSWTFRASGYWPWTGLIHELYCQSLLSFDFHWTVSTMRSNYGLKSLCTIYLSIYRFHFVLGVSADADPHYHKLCSRVSHIWGNRRLQRHLSAMVESRPEGTALLITVSFEPGKYAFWGSFLWLVKIIASKTINHALSKMTNPQMKFG